MAETKEPDVVSTTLHLADGTATTDKSKAVSAEVVTRNPDGSLTHTLLMKKSGSEQPGDL